MPTSQPLVACWRHNQHGRWKPGALIPRQRRRLASNGLWFAAGPSAFSPSDWSGSLPPLAAVPRVGVHRGCHRHCVPGLRTLGAAGSSPSQWDCAELARQFIAKCILPDIPAVAVRWIWSTHQSKPWCNHVWLDLKQPRDAALYATVSELINLQTGRLPLDELVLTMRYTSDFPHVGCGPLAAMVPASSIIRPANLRGMGFQGGWSLDVGTPSWTSLGRVDCLIKHVAWQMVFPDGFRAGSIHEEREFSSVVFNCL